MSGQPTSAPRKGAWARPLPAASQQPAAAARGGTLRDIQSEQLAQALAEAPARAADVANEDDDFALALALQREEEEAQRQGGHPPPVAPQPASPPLAPAAATTAAPATTVAAAAISSTEDEDLALALALQEEELRLSGGAAGPAASAAAPRRGGAPGAKQPPGGGAGGGMKVQLVSREEREAAAALAAVRASTRPGRRLYSEADADELGSGAGRGSGAPALASALPSAAGVGAPPARPTPAAADAELAAALREHSEEALYQALKGGSGRRAGYLAVGPEAQSAAGAAAGAQQAPLPPGTPSGGGGVSATGVASNVASLGSDGYLTKHDAYLSGRRNARAVERQLGPSASGDLSRVTVSQAAVGGLQRFMQRQSVKGTAAHGRVEAAAHATAEGVLDARTRLTLFKLLASGRLDAVGGVVATGKEANVLLGAGWHADVHAELTHAAAAGADGGWASQKSRVWDGSAAVDDEDDDDEGDGQEEGDDGHDEDDEAAAEEAERAAAAAAPALAERPLSARAATAASAPHPLLPPSATHGLNDDGTTDVAVKVFKTTLNEFSNRKAYMDGDRRYAKMPLRRLNPRKVVTAWAEKEFKNLVRLHRAGIPCPAPLLLSGPVLVVSFLGENGVPAPQLRHADLGGPSAWGVAYRQVVAIMCALHKWTHLVHADLSEYNMLWWRGRVHVIDVGQAVDTSHPTADGFLAADAEHLTAFFARKGVDVLPPHELVALVTDPSLAPHPPASAERTGSYAGTVPSAGSGIRRTRQDEATHAAASASAPLAVVAGSGECIVPGADSGRKVVSFAAGVEHAAPAPVGGGNDDGDAAAAGTDADASSTVYTGPPRVYVPDYDADELFGGRRGPIAAAVTARLAALQRDSDE